MSPPLLRWIRRESGMSALQTVIILAAAFVVTFGIVTVWNEVSVSLSDKVERTVQGQVGGPVAMIAPPTAPTIDIPTMPKAPAPKTPPKPPIAPTPKAPPPPEAMKPKDRSLLDLLGQLYTPEFSGGFHSPEALQEIDDRFSDNILLWPFQVFVIPEIRTQQIKYQKTNWDKAKTIADGLFNMTDLIPAKKGAGLIINATEKAVKETSEKAVKEATEQGLKQGTKQGLKKSLRQSTQKELTDLLEQTTNQQEAKELLLDLWKKDPDSVRIVTSRNGADQLMIKTGDGKVLGVRLDGGELKKRPPVTIDGKTRDSIFAGDIPHQHWDDIDPKAFNKPRYETDDVLKNLEDSRNPRAPRLPGNTPDEKKLQKAKDAAATHHPSPNRGTFKYDPESGKFVNEVEREIEAIKKLQKKRFENQGPGGPANPPGSASSLTNPSGSTGPTPSGRPNLRNRTGVDPVPIAGEREKPPPQTDTPSPLDQAKNLARSRPVVLAPPRNEMTSPKIPSQGLLKSTNSVLRQIDEVSFKLGRLIPGLRPTPTEK